jgi:BTB/POZ domain
LICPSRKANTSSDTGDVQFICLEKASREYSQVPTSPTPPNTANSESRLSSSSTHSLAGSRITARKRIIFAHSDILMHRSEYFSSMLSSAFAETVPSGERKIHTIIVEEADFVTIYWLLKWVYANWLLFKEEDDPRSAVEGIGAGWSARWLSTRGTAGEWDWKTFSKNSAVDDDIVSAASGDSVHSHVDGRGSGSSQGKSTFQNSQSTSPAIRSAVQRPSSSSKSPPSTNLRSTSSTVSRRGTVPDSASISMSVSSPPHSSSGRSVQPISIGSSHYANTAQRPRPRTSASPGDPHAHPTSTPAPASAFSVYQIAHRYEMPGLATLALEHMMATITPHSCFALLLASVVWDELHSLVEVSTYVYLTLKIWYSVHSRILSWTGGVKFRSRKSLNRAVRRWPRESTLLSYLL